VPMHFSAPGWRGSTGLFLRQRGHHQSAPFTAQLISPCSAMPALLRLRPGAYSIIQVIFHTPFI
jgi:hypothetical protein